MPEKQTKKTPGLLDSLLGGGAAAPKQDPKEAAKSSGGFLDMILGSPPKKAKKKEIKKGDEIGAEDKDTEQFYEEGLQKVLDIISPSAVEIKARQIVLGDGTLCRTFFAFNWPNQIHNNWLSSLVNYEAAMDISQFIYPTENARVMNMLKRKVTQMRASLHMRQDKGLSRDPQLEAALRDAEWLRDMLAQGVEKLFQFGLYITIYANNEEKLKKTQGDIESILGGKLILTRGADFQMEHGWNSTLPLCLDEIEINRNMNTSPLATSFPFSSSDLTSDKGILYGINRHNESLVIFDRFSLPNANSTVFATSGAGKSYTVKLEIIRYLMMDTDVYVIDPENEYTELANVMGGTVVPLSVRSEFRINPFDLPKPMRKSASAASDDEESKPGELLRSAVINLHGLFKLMLKNITPEQESILDKAILDTYALKGIDLQTENPGEMEPPTLHELVDVLTTTEGGEQMANIMKKYTEGSFAGIFNQQTNIDIDSNLMVFQTRDLEESLRPMAIYITLNFLWNSVRSNLKKRLIVVDEAWNIMQYEDSARFLYGLIKRARKYYLGITTITQDVEDFMNSPFGKPIVTNAAMQMLLKQAPSAIDSLKKTFNLTEGEKYLLLNAGVGQGVFFAGRKHAALQIVASPKEHEIVTTNPEELAKRQAQKAAETESDIKKNIETNIDEAISEDKPAEEKAEDTETKIEENVEKTTPEDDSDEPTSFEAPPEK